MSFTADFSRLSNYDENGNAILVRFAAGAPALETEVNEIQLIADRRFREIGKLFGDGLYGNGTISYADNKLKLSKFGAIVSGYMFTMTNLELTLLAGETAYLDVYIKEVNLNDPMHKGGNDQEPEIRNYIMDSRFGKEVSRRKLLCYNLVKKATAGSHFYMELGRVDTTGRFLMTARKFNFDFDGEGTFRRMDVLEQQFRQVKRDVSMLVSSKQIIASRPRDSNKPDYDFIASPMNAVLEAVTFTGRTFASVVVDGVEYDALNVKDSTQSVANGDLIVEYE